MAANEGGDEIGKFVQAAKAAANSAATVMGKLGLGSASIQRNSLNPKVRGFSTHLKAENKGRVMHSELSSKDVVGRRTSRKDKSIEELDLSNCKRCTPSYYLLPNNYPIAIASQKTKIGAEVLNDQWICRSKDKRFKDVGKNPYEEMLFQCEDDMSDLDVLLGSANIAAKHAEILLKDIDKKLSGPSCVENYFSVLDLRSIERLYGEYGLCLLDLLRENPSLGLPVILFRLKQKRMEWLKCRTSFNEVWAEIFSKYHHQSLDHRSLTFKDGPPLASEGPAPPPEIQICRICKGKFEDLEFHMRRKYIVTLPGVERYRCRHCPGVIGNMEEILRHLQSHCDGRVH